MKPRLLALNLLLGTLLSGTALAARAQYAPVVPVVPVVPVAPVAPAVSVGINLPAYPAMTAVPGMPVSYAPGVAANLFYFDSAFWLFQRNNWYRSTWYNGPWQPIDPYSVPDFLLRVPVHYYRVPPPYFRGWRADQPPHWDTRWGPAWVQRRPGWNQWNRAAVPAAAPLHGYQRTYPDARHPHHDARQREITAGAFGAGTNRRGDGPHRDNHTERGRQGLSAGIQP